jgi:hypothetical protein
MKVGFVTLCRPEDYRGGDRILDDRVEQALAVHVTVERLELPRDRARHAILRTLAHASHPAHETYAQRANARAIAAFASGCDALVASHEALLAPFLEAKVAGPACLILHNVLSQALGDMGLRGLFRGAAQRLEMRAARRPQTSLLVLSQRERTGLAALGIANVLACPPGVREVFATRPLRLDATRLILGGSADWGLKKRDLDRFRADFDAAGMAPSLVGEEALADDGTLRIAIVTDRFQTGFKLKTADLLCRNAALIGFVDPAADFPESCRPARTFRRISEVSELPAAIAAIESDLTAVAAELEAIKRAASERMTWERMGEALLQALAQARAQPAPGNGPG